MVAGDGARFAAMRVRDDWQRFSISAILLLLSAGFAITPPDCYRFQNAGRRTRPGRMVWAHSHDRYQPLAGTALETDHHSSDEVRPDDSRTRGALLPQSQSPGLPVTAARRTPDDGRLIPFAICCSPWSGRAPPTC